MPILIFFTFSAWADGGTGLLDLDLKQDRYFGQALADKQTSNYTDFTGEMNLQPKTEWMNFKLNALAEGNFEHSEEFYFGVPEAYLEEKGLAPGFDVVLGRQKRHWSRLDEEFNLGVWQPQLRWDYLDPRQQGLTGVFLDWDLPAGFHLTLLGSPVFLPDQGPNFQIKNGQFVSSNRWFTPPQSRLALFQGTDFASSAPLYFQLDRPAEEKVIMHPTLGVGLRFDGDGGWWAQANYAYKPRNQLHLGIECSNCVRLPENSGVEITAVVHPVVVMHNVVTVETGFNHVDDHAWISLTADRPDPSGLPADYEESPLDAVMIAGGAYEHYLGGSWLPPNWIRVSYMQSFVTSKTDRKGMVDSDQVNSSLDRYPFTQLAALDWRIRLRQKRSNRIEFATRYWYSVPERGGWLALNLDYAQDSFIYTIGADILGSAVSADSIDAGLFTRYRSNDRVMGGVTYVF